MTELRRDISPSAVEEVLALTLTEREKLIGSLSLTHRPQRWYLGHDTAKGPQTDEQYAARHTIRVQQIAACLAAAVTLLTNLARLSGRTRLRIPMRRMPQPSGWNE